MKSVVKIFTTFILAVLFNVLVTGCGKSYADEMSVPTDDNAYVYVAQNLQMPQFMGTYMNDVYMIEDKLYYVQTKKGNSGPLKESLYCFDLTQEKPEPVIVAELPALTAVDGFEAYPLKRVITTDGGMISVIENYPVTEDTKAQSIEERDHSDSVFYLNKTDKDNQELFNMDITSYLKKGDVTCTVAYAVVSEDGYIFLSDGYLYILVLNSKGEYVTDIGLDVDWANGIYVQSFGLTGDGRAAYIEKNVTGYSMYVYDNKKKDFSEKYGNLPVNCQLTPLTPGLSQGVLISGKDALYEYDPVKQDYSVLTQWVDVDIIQVDTMSNTYTLSNGDIAVFFKDSAHNTNSVILLKRTLASEVRIKKTIVLCEFLSSDWLANSVVEFNKNNEDYRIIIQSGDLDFSSPTFYDDLKAAQQSLQLDIAAGQGPDLFMDDYVNLELLVQKGCIEDLNPYLDKSQVINRQDLIEPALRSYELNDKLCGLPYDFIVRTFIGRTSDLGEKTHWTLDEMMDYANEYPDSVIYNSLYNNLLVSDLISCDMPSFVNWETGECNFNSELFKKLLELSKEYPNFDGVNDDTLDAGTTPFDIKSHGALLCYSVFRTPFCLQRIKSYFDEPITVIGYPTKDTDGVYLNSSNALCMNAASKNKEGAWAFIETLFAEYPEADTFWQSYPVKKSVFDQMMEEAMTPTYVTDEDGAIALDEKGDPILVPKYTENWDEISLYFYSITQEEVDELWEIINRSQGMGLGNGDVMNIISEETAPYYLGQKTVDEVADIIQGRVTIFVNESK